MTEGRALTKSEIQLIKVLAQDLLPNRPSTEVSEDNFSELIYELAREDSKWNRALGDALNSFYRQVEDGQKTEGLKTLQMFVSSCPSSWYRSHAETEIENIGEV